MSPEPAIEISLSQSSTIMSAKASASTAEYPDISKTRTTSTSEREFNPPLDTPDFESDYDDFLDSIKISKNTFRLETIGLLIGHQNYDDWSSSMKFIFEAMDCRELIIDGMKPTASATKKAITNYRYLHNQARLILIQSVEKPILRIITKKNNGHEIWTYLKESYYRDSHFSFTSQILNLALLSYAYDPAKPIKTFIDRFEMEWEKLETLAKSDTDPYRIAFHTYLTHDKARRDFLLAFIKNHHKNIVDNLTTKDDLSYSDVLKRLRELDDGGDIKEISDVALTTSTTNKKNKRKKKDDQPKPDKDQKDCSYCRKHSPGRSSGHTWQDCRKLKADRENKKIEDAKVMEEEDVSNPTSIALHLTSLPTPTSWIFDTAASSHMTSNKDLFDRLQPHHRIVRTGDASPLSAEGIGSLVINAMLPDGSLSRVRIKDVLYVPSLRCSLFSWRAVCKKGGLRMVAEGRKIGLWKENEMILEAEMNGNLFYIREKIIDIALTTSSSISTPSPPSAPPITPTIARTAVPFAATSSSSTSTFDHWHTALGHAAPTSMRQTLYSDGHLIPKLSSSTSFHCEACALSKSKHRVPAPSHRRAERPLELIHSDLSGRFSQPSLGGSQYYISFTDDFTRFTWIEFLKNKSDAVRKIIDLITMLERQHKTKILRLRTDNGGEYVNQDLKLHLNTNGIIHELTPPYAHESNGVAERLNRTILEMVRAMLGSLNKRLWAQAVHTAIYIKNRLPHSAVKDQTPYEALHQTKPSISHLQPFGRKCYVHIPTERRPAGSKLLPRADQGLFVGYTESTHIYQVYIPSRNHVFTSRDVQFAPIAEGDIAGFTQPIDHSTGQSIDQSTRSTYRTSTLRASTNSPIDVHIDSSSINAHADPSTEPTGIPINAPTGFTNAPVDPPPPTNQPTIPQQFSHVQLPPPPINRSEYLPHPPALKLTPKPRTGRIGKAPTSRIRSKSPPVAHHTSRILDDITPAAATSSDHPINDPTDDPMDLDDPADDIMIVNEDDEPSTYRRALASPDKKLWQDAMKAELQALSENDTWDIVDRPTNRKIVDCRWVYKIKRNADGSIERYKARLVAKGFSQIPGLDYDETFGPVVRFDSLRLLIKCDRFSYGEW